MIYLAETVGAPFTKIGVSTDVEARVRALQTGCPYTIRVYAEIAVASACGDFWGEQFLHRVLHSHKVRPDGEWFAIRPVQVLRFLIAPSYQRDLLRALGKQILEYHGVPFEQVTIRRSGKVLLRKNSKCGSRVVPSPWKIGAAA